MIAARIRIISDSWSVPWEKRSYMDFIIPREKRKRARVINTLRGLK
jgi:hypothetical protein